MNLLTGATGLVGAHVLAQLVSSKAKTRALYRTEDKKQMALSVLTDYGLSKTQIHSYVDWQTCDILDIPELETVFQDVTHIYHCAGFISNSPSEYKQMRKVNIEGTANMVNMSIHFGVQKFCHVSSIATLGQPVRNTTKITEQTPQAEDQKRSAYEISKYGAEMEVWRGSQEGIDVVIVNPGIILGDGFENTGSSKLLSKMKNGLNVYPPKTTGFVGVYDVSKVMLQLMNSEIKNERYILVSDNLTFKEAITRVANAFGKPGPRIEVRPWMLYAFWFFEVLRSFFTPYKRQLTLEVIPGLFEDSCYASGKIKTDLNFSFEAFDVYIEKIKKRSSAISAS